MKEMRKQGKIYLNLILKVIIARKNVEFQLFSIKILKKLKF